MKHFWVISIPARTWSNAYNWLYVSFGINTELFPLKISILLNMTSNRKSFQVCMHISKNPAWHWQQYVSICKTHFSLCPEKVRLNPLALIPAAIVSPSLLLEMGKIVIVKIVESPLKIQIFPVTVVQSIKKFLTGSLFLLSISFTLTNLSLGTNV